MDYPRNAQPTDSGPGFNIAVCYPVVKVPVVAYPIARQPVARVPAVGNLRDGSLTNKGITIPLSSASASIHDLSPTAMFGGRAQVVRRCGSAWLMPFGKPRYPARSLD